jgi:hypothetical protein
MAAHASEQERHAGDLRIRSTPATRARRGKGAGDAICASGRYFWPSAKVSHAAYIRADARLFCGERFEEKISRTAPNIPRKTGTPPEDKAKC